MRYSPRISSSTVQMLAALLAAVLLATVAIPAANAQQNFDLTILHTNDVHARHDQFDRFGGSCDEEEAAEEECYGGAPRRLTMVNEIRSEVDNVVVLDGGDQFQGTLFYNQYKGQAAAETMMAIGYDGMVVGNHEFDDGPGTLADFIDAVDFPVLSANIDDSAEPDLAGKVAGTAIIDVGGEQVGLVGYTTEDTAILSSPGAVAFRDIATSVQAGVDELEAAGVNRIIALSHSGFGKDLDIATMVSGLDVIISGHTNTFLSNTDEDAEGPYPTLATAPDGQNVLVVSDGAWGRHLGRLDVTFDADGVITAYEGDPILLDASVEADPGLQTRVDELAEPLNALLELEVGEAAVDLDGDRANCRHAECTMGNLITDAILASTAAEGTQIALQNGGGIRASIPAGTVTAGDVLTVLPFGNTISTFELTGDQVVEALENSVSRAESAENEGTGRFAQVSGLRYKWDSEQPAGERVHSVEVRAADGSYSAIDSGATYKVAANNFIRNGGDDYGVLTEAANAYDFGEVLADAVQAYIGKTGPVAPELEGRITQAAKPAGALPDTGFSGAQLAIFGLALLAAGALIIDSTRSLRRE